MDGCKDAYLVGRITALTGYSSTSTCTRKFRMTIHGHHMGLKYRPCGGLQVAPTFNGSGLELTKDVPAVDQRVAW